MKHFEREILLVKLSPKGAQTERFASSGTRVSCAKNLKNKKN